MTESLTLLRRDKPALLLIIVTYLLCLGALVSFAAIGLATLPQVAASFLTPALALWFFFVWQALSVSYAPDQPKTAWLRGAVRLSGVLLLASLPLLLLALGASWYLSTTKAAESPFLWLLLRVIAWLVLPLTMMHAWVSAARAGIVRTWARLPRIFLTALAPQSLIVYVVGFIVFAVMPYLILQARLPMGWGRWQIGWLVVRIILAVALIGVGWTLTLMTVARNTKAAH